MWKDRSFMIKGYAISFSLMVIWVLIQLLVFQISSTKQLFRTFTLLFIPSIPVYVIWYLKTSPTMGFLPEALSRTPSLLGLLNGLGLHGLFYLTYVAFFYYIDRPVTLRFLITFLKAPDEKLTLLEVKTAYRLDRMIGRRLEAMKHGGLVVEQGGRYVLTPKGERLGKCFEHVRKVLKIKRGTR